MTARLTRRWMSLVAAGLLAAGPARASATPRETVAGFLEASGRGDYEEAARFLDLGEAPREPGPDLARHLHAVLDQKLWVDLESLADSAQGASHDGLPPGIDSVGTIATRRGDVPILLERKPDAGGEGIWRFSTSTVRRIPALYEEFGYGALGEILPRRFFTSRFLGIQLWQWIGLPLLILVAVLLSRVLTGVVYRAVGFLTRRTRTELDDLVLDLTLSPARALGALVLFSAGLHLLRLAAPAARTLGRINLVVGTVIVTWLCVQILDVFVNLLRRRLESQGRRAAAAILPLGSKAAKVVVVLLAGITLFQNLGVNVTGLLAGLGVGGIALALAAQKTVENLFGGVSLTVDQPVRVGDYCEFDTVRGHVEDVGLRSTSIRTLDRTLITVPNAVLAQASIENFAPRDRIRLHTTLGLRSETTPDALRRVLVDLRALLANHPHVLPDQLRVRFVGFGSHTLDIEVFAYVGTSDFNEFLAIREEIYLRMMDILAAAGTGLALPSQTVYLGRDREPVKPTT